MHFRGLRQGKIVLLVILLFTTLPAFSQNLKLLDSLKSTLRATSSPEKQFDILTTIGFEYRYSFPDSTIFYCNRAYELGQRINAKRGLARPLSFLGLAKANQGDYKAALEYQNRSLLVARWQEDTLQLAHGYNNVGRIFFDEGDLVRAYSNFMKSRELFEKLHDKSGLAYIHRSLATLLKSKKDFKMALENSQKALALRKELGDSRTITSAYMELGLVYEEMDSISLALKQFKFADSIASPTNDRVTKSEIKIGIAEILFIDHKIDESELIAKDVLKIVSANTNQKIYLRAKILLGKCELAEKMNKEAITILTDVFASSEKSGNLVFQRDAARLLSKAYGYISQTSKEDQFNDIYQILNEKIQNADLNKEIDRLQFQLQIEKKEKENEALKARQLNDETLIVQQRSENLLLIIAAVFAVVIAAVIWSVSQRRKVINKTLADQNYRILQQREEITTQNEILSKRNNDLDDLNQEKDTLMNIVAHDLKSPLNRISGLIRILEMEGNLSPNQQEYVRLVKESTRGGLSLIADLLDVHAWEEQRENPITSAFQFDEFVHQKIESFRLMAEAKGISIKIENSVDKKIISEPDYLGRILDNLISNAIKFSPAGAKVVVKGSLSNSNLILSIKDNGPGFQSADLEYLFQKFKKLSARPTAGESSNGLGLAIVKTLVDRLGGSVDLKTDSGKGSEFLVRIPVGIFQQVTV